MEKQRVLVVVDMQNDFVTGSLGTKEAEAIVLNVEKKIESWKGPVFVTKDTHAANYLDTLEGKNLPVEHCIKDTNGWKLVDEIFDTLTTYKDYRVIEKPTFGSKKLAKAIRKMVKKGKVESIELIGLCTDICVISNALILKAYVPEIPISVDASCCAGVTPQKHAAALEVMKSCHITITNEEKGVKDDIENCQA